MRRICYPLLNSHDLTRASIQKSVHLRTSLTVYNIVVELDWKVRDHVDDVADSIFIEVERPTTNETL